MRLTLTAGLLPTGEAPPGPWGTAAGLQCPWPGCFQSYTQGVCSPGRGSPGVGAQWGHGTRVLPLLRRSGPEQAPCSWLPGHGRSPGPLTVQPRRRPAFRHPLL